MQSQISTVKELFIMRQQLSWSRITLRLCIVLIGNVICKHLALYFKQKPIIFLSTPKTSLLYKSNNAKIWDLNTSFLLLSNLEELNKRIIWNKPFLSEWAFRDKTTIIEEREREREREREKEKYRWNKKCNKPVCFC